MVGVVLLHFISRNIYKRAVRDQEIAMQASLPVQLQQSPQDMGAQPVAAFEEPAKEGPKVVVLVLHPDNEVRSTATIGNLTYLPFIAGQLCSRLVYIHYTVVLLIRQRC